MNNVRTSITFAKELASHGYHVYSDIQYQYNVDKINNIIGDKYFSI